MRVLTLGDKLLREKSIPVPAVDDEIRKLIDDMGRTMLAENGLGLAAPQVGELLRLFVCKIPEDDDVRVFINPEIIETSERMVKYEEGCLSIPGLYAAVLRSERIILQAMNLYGKVFKIEADGLLARVILHEFDHLNGKLFIDHLDDRKREKLLKNYGGNRK